MAMYRFQSQLRRLPVAQLGQTVQDAVAFASVLDPCAAVRLQSLADTMTSSGIEKVQARLEAWADAAPTGNWLEPLWDDGYLAWDGMLPIDMNYFLEANLEDAPHLAEVSQADVAVEVCRASLAHFNRIQSGDLPCSKDGKGYLDMSQHARVFGHARVPEPGGGEDTAYCYADKPSALEEPGAGGNHYKTRFVPVHGPRQLAVLRHGHMFIVDLTDPSQSELSPTLSASLSFIASDTWLASEAAGSSLPQHNMGMLTASGRELRVAAREALKSRSPDWQALLSAIDRSLFVLCLDDGSPEDENELLARFIHGTGDTKAQRWFEKHSVVVSPSPVSRPGCGHRVGMLFEHMAGDGMTTLDWVSAVQLHLAAWPASAPQAQAATPGLAASLTSPGRSSVRLECSMAAGDALHACVVEGGAALRARAAAMSCRALRVEDYGASRLKASGLPPDAGFQLALQLARFNAHGRLCATYESCATTRFLHGRTEVIRGASVEAFRAVRAITELEAGSSTADVAETASAISAACKAHQAFTQRAKEGLGIDRHLTGLKHMIATEEFPEHVAEAARAFLNDPAIVAASSWDLSTSNCGNMHTSFFGFGPVTAAGTGVGYFITPDEIRATVTAFGDVDAATFADHVSKAVDQIARISHTAAE